MRAFAQFLANKKLGVDQIDKERTISEELRIASQIVTRAELLAVPPTLAEIDSHDGGFARSRSSASSSARRS